MREVGVKLTGASPLLMHNAQMIDPLGAVPKSIKKLTSKRKKTEEDELEIRRLEWHGGLYHDDDLGPFVPAANVERCFRDAATASRDGKQVQRAVLIEQVNLPLLYRGPRDPEGMWSANGTFKSQMPVRVGMQRVIRTRPMFRDWALDFTVLLDDTLLDFENFVDIAERAGRTTGLGDGRPRFGRFNTEIAA